MSRIHGCTERFAETSDSSCTAGAVHTWPITSFCGDAAIQSLLERSGHSAGRVGLFGRIVRALKRLREDEAVTKPPDATA